MTPAGARETPLTDACLPASQTLSQVCIRNKHRPVRLQKQHFHLCCHRSSTQLDFGTGYGYIAKLHTNSSDEFIARGGRIPAPIQSYNN